LAGVNVIREPDKGVVTHTSEDDPALKPGDNLLRYGLDSNGDWNLWTNGAWHKADAEKVVDKGTSCGFADKTECYIAITENGAREWWINVKANPGQEGWVLMEKTTQDKTWQSGTFGELCTLD
jgi:hypothetical protein